MIVLGIDPGTKVTGYGVVRSEGGILTPLDFGAIRPPASKELPDKYWIIFSALHGLIEKYRPETVVIETQFVQRNVQTALKLGMARGASIIAAKMSGAAVEEYSPSTVKKAVTGRGGATKGQVQAMVQNLLRLKTLPTPEDAADALALAIAYLHRNRKGIVCTAS
ncbi:MAG: crossover junction endodeoxyribonuclease RuvC [Chlamydiia bacterium]|nr:crossover junction endodeoxyribonuclease RuvC [Chlamydiia bacterium]